MSDLTSEGVEKFFQKYKQKTYKRGQIILHPDEEPPTDIYFIESGHIKVYSLTEDGNEMCHLFYGPGEMFPMVSFFINQTRDVFFEAMEETVIRKADKDEFMSFIKSNGKYLMDIILRLSRVLKVYADRIDNLEYTKAYTRVISRLLSLSERFGKEYQGSVLLEIPVTHKEIASTIGLTRETTTRELLILMEKGLINQKGHLIVINNIDKLKRELKDSL